MRAGRFTTALIVLAAVSGAARADRPSGTVDQVPTRALAGWSETGVASYYAEPFVGRPTASGVRFDTEAPMAAHKSLGFGSVVKVVNLANGKQAWVVIRDRGPFVRGRIIDLSRYSARQLGMLDAGTAPVRIEVMR